MKPLRLIELVPKDGLGEVWVKVAVERCEEEGVSREDYITAKLTEGAMRKIKEQGLEAAGLCLLKLTETTFSENTFRVVATLEEKNDNPPKIYRKPRILGKTLDFRLSRGERG